MFTAGIIERVSRDKVRIDNFIDQLLTGRLSYIFLADNPFREAIRYIRELMQLNPKLDILPIVQRHRMYFEAKIKEMKDNVW